METAELRMRSILSELVSRSMEIQSRQASEGRIMTAIRSVRSSFRSPGGTLDLLFACCLAFTGIWMVQPFILELRYPVIVSDMERIVPLSAWGVIFITVGGTVALAVFLRQRALLGVLHTLSLVLWVTTAWIWGFRPTVPPVLGVLAPIFAFFIFVRVMQLPTNEV